MIERKTAGRPMPANTIGSIPLLLRIRQRMTRYKVYFQLYYSRKHGAYYVELRTEDKPVVRTFGPYGYQHLMGLARMVGAANVYDAGKKIAVMSQNGDIHEEQPLHAHQKFLVVSPALREMLRALGDYPEALATIREIMLDEHGATDVVNHQGGLTPHKVPPDAPSWTWGKDQPPLDHLLMSSAGVDDVTAAVTEGINP